MTLLSALVLLLAPPAVGDVHELKSEKTSTSRDSDGGTGNSFDRDSLIERVVAVRPDGVELIYDLPPETTAQVRASQWYFPARVLRPTTGSLQLIDRLALEQRRDRWLAQAKLTKAMCGRWIFTWNAFQIDCDPDNALKAVALFDPWPAELREGALYRDANIAAPIPLIRQDTPGDQVFGATAPLDPTALRRTQAEADRAIAELLRKPVPTLEDALQAHAADRITGTVAVRMRDDHTGRHLTRTTTIDTALASRTLHRVVTETFVRRPLTRSGS